MDQAGLTFTRTLTEADCQILTPEALGFLAALVERFTPARNRLLDDRNDWQSRIDAGALPDFRSDTRLIREDDWRIAALPADLLDRRVEITGPAEPKMVINALNADVKLFMADFEDALSPTWANVIGGQRALRDAILRTLTHDDPATGKHYQLGPDPAVLVARVRGLHLDEKHILFEGRPVPGCLVDFGLYLFHNHAALAALGSGPYFYLPKLEHAEEARWWNDVFVFAQAWLALPPGTVKATVLIETLPAVFEMDEILFELKDHIAALNCGRWDYIFSYIKTLRAHPDRLLPDRQSVTMDRPFLDAYSRLLIRTCHRRGALAMGGMSAFIPSKDPAENTAVLEKVRADKTREAGHGHDGSWIAHPGLAGVVNAVYGAAFAPGQTNQLERRREEDAPVLAADLLAPPEGPFTEIGLRHNIRVALRYIEAWLGGSGAVAIYGLMEDAATAEISRASIWQWIRHGVVIDGETVMTGDLFERALEEEAETVRREVGEDRWEAGGWRRAGALLRDLCLEDGFEPFLTLGAYRYL
jgi:malate synthase